MNEIFVFRSIYMLNNKERKDGCVMIEKNNTVNLH